MQLLVIVDIGKVSDEGLVWQDRLATKTYPTRFIARLSGLVFETGRFIRVTIHNSAAESLIFF